MDLLSIFQQLSTYQVLKLKMESSSVSFHLLVQVISSVFSSQREAH
jgi:hypothetical protein